MKRQLWWQAVLFGVFGVLTAVVALMAERLVPWPLPFEVSREAVNTLLGVISSSMLSVTTFSLGAMTAAFGAATANVTPRATQLLMEDRVTHNVLSTFIGAFVFSIVGLIVLNTGSYGEHGRAVLFLITILILGVIVIQLLRWISHLIVLGRSGSTIDRVEASATAAVRERMETPYLGGHPWWDLEARPNDATPINSNIIGHIQFVDVETLSQICEREALHVWVPINAGSFVYSDTVLVWVQGRLTPELEDELRDQFVVASGRSFEQDPRFGLAVLAEVGSRALSPATNDAGTAMDIVVRLTRILSIWAEGREEAEVAYPRLHINPIRDDDLFEDAFWIMGRDAAGLVEIQLRMQKSLAFLQGIGSESFRAAARRQAAIAYDRARAALTLPSDLQRLEEVAGAPKPKLAARISE